MLGSGHSTAQKLFNFALRRVIAKKINPSNRVATNLDTIPYDGMIAMMGHWGRGAENTDRSSVGGDVRWDNLCHWDETSCI